MHKKTAKLRALSMIAALALVLSGMLGFGTPVVADELSDLESKLAELEKQEKELANKISSANKDLKDKKAYKESLNERIQNVIKQLDLLDEQMKTLNSKLAEKNSAIQSSEQAIAEKEAAIDAQFQELRQRLRAISKSGNMSVLQMLLSTEDFTDYLMKAKAMERIAENDQRLIEGLEAEIQTINAEKDALNADRQKLEDAKVVLAAVKSKSDSQKKNLNNLYNEYNRAIKDLEEDLDTYRENQRNLEKQQKEIDAKIDQILADSKPSGEYTRGTMFWPVPGFNTITSPFGPRWGKTHRGYDIGGYNIYGANIIAAADGVVLVSEYHWSFGNYVMVDHGLDKNGKRIVTLYAHASKLNVKVGQKVIGGKTVLAQVGSTGDSSGPHLHFEVRENNTAVDSIKLGYIVVPK